LNLLLEQFHNLVEVGVEELLQLEIKLPMRWQEVNQHW